MEINKYAASKACRIQDIWLNRAEWLIKNESEKYGNHDVLELAYAIRARCSSIGTSIFYTMGSHEPHKDPFDENISATGVLKGNIKRYMNCNTDEVFELNRDNKFNIKTFHDIMQHAVFLSPNKSVSKTEYVNGIDSNIFEDETLNLDLKLKVKRYNGTLNREVKTITLRDIMAPVEKKVSEIVAKVYKDKKREKPTVKLELVKPHISTSVWIRISIGVSNRKRRTYLKQVGHIYFAYSSRSSSYGPLELSDLHKEVEKIMLEKVLDSLPD